MTHRAWTSMLSLVILLPIAAAAQSPLPTVPVDSGREVRAEFPKEQVRGRLLLRYTPGDSTMRVCTYPAWRCGGGGESSVIRELRTQAMVRLEVQRGTESKKGAIIGGVVGGILGGLFGTFVAGMCDAAECPSLFMGTARGAVTGGAAIGLLGYGIGHSITRWGPAP
jgi:hypothetical protein